MRGKGSSLGGRSVGGYRFRGGAVEREREKKHSTFGR